VLPVPEFVPCTAPPAPRVRVVGVQSVDRQTGNAQDEHAGVVWLCIRRRLEMLTRNGHGVLRFVATSVSRMTRFCEWLAARPEQRIVCVGHLDFFRQLLNVRLRNCGVAKYELSSEGWKQRAVAEVQKSVVQQWIHEMRASSDEDAKYSASKLIAETKNVFVRFP